MNFNKKFLARLAVLSAALGISGAPDVSCMEKKICLICLDEMKTDNMFNTNVGAFACGHKFHTDCMAKWSAKGGKTCPECNTKLVGENRGYVNSHYVSLPTKDNLITSILRDIIVEKGKVEANNTEEIEKRIATVKEDPKNRELLNSAITDDDMTKYRELFKKQQIAEQNCASLEQQMTNEGDLDPNIFNEHESSRKKSQDLQEELDKLLNLFKEKVVKFGVIIG